MSEREDNCIKERLSKAGQYGTIQQQENKTPTDQETSGDRTNPVTDQDCCSLWSIPDDFVTETRILFRLAWPIVLAFLLSFFPTTIAVIFCGHLGRTELSAVGLSSSMMFVSGTIVAFGMSSACETYFSQYHGSVNRHKLGVILQKGLLIMLLTSVPCIAIQLNTASILQYFGQTPDVCRLAGRYLLIGIPNTVAMFVILTLIRFLQCQNIVLPHLLAGIGWTVLDAFFHYVFVIEAQMGTDGSALAHSLTFCLVTMAMALYIRFSGILKETWQGWTWECLDDWGDFVRLGVLGAVILSVDSWCFEAGLVLAGLLSDVDLAAQTVIFQLNGVISMGVVGIGIACGIRVGNMLGAGNKTAARTSTQVGLLASAVVGVIIAVFVYAIKADLPTIYTSDSQTIHLIAQVIPILAVRIIFGSIGVTVEGILRGCGRQEIDALVVFSGHVVSLVVGTSLMFETSLELYGQWLGYSSGMVLEAAAGLFIVLRTDWDHQIQEALKLTKSTSKENISSSSTDSQPASDTRTEEASELQQDDVPLVPMSQSSQSRSEEESTNKSFLLSTTTIVRRLCAVLLVVVILVLGVAVRLTIQNDDVMDHSNSTDIITGVNTTASSI